MNPLPAQLYLDGLVAELRKLPTETPWLEFKENNSNPEDIGEYISALGNMAALHGKASGYLIWGVQDGTHQVVGTSFSPAKAKKGNEDLESWLTRLISPRVHFQFHELIHDGQPVVVLEVPRAPGRPLQFQGVEFIRVGSYRQKLKDHPQIEKELWRVFDTTPFEETLVMEHVDAARRLMKTKTNFEETLVMEHVDAGTVLSLLDYPAYFELLSLPLPENRDGILEKLADERMIVRDAAGGWGITSLGAFCLPRTLMPSRRSPARPCG